MITAAPCKLRDGSWGAKTTSAVQTGDEIQITTRAGKSWAARVTGIVWSGNGTSIVSTASLDRPRGSARTGCDCDNECCRPRCRCESHCICRGGNIYDC